MKTTKRTPPMQWAEVPAWAIKRYPNGTTFKQNKDGTITPILPKKQPKKGV